MSLLLLLGGAVSPPSPASSWDVTFVLFDAAHGERWPVYPIDGTFGHDKTMNGTASLLFPYDDDAVTLFMGGTVGQEFPDVTLRCYCRGTRIWTGVAMTARLSTDRGGTVEVTFEHAYQHVQRIRTIYYTSVNSFDVTAGADNVLLAVQRGQIGPTPVMPTGHPGTRTDFGSFAVTVTAAHSPALAPSARMLEQSGTNLLDVANDWLIAHDLAPVFTDASTGTWVLDVDYPFESHDVTDLVRFGQWHGNLAKFELVSDRSALSNIWAIEGKTAKGLVFDDDAPSVILWGEAEAFGQIPQDTNDTAASTQAAADMVAAHGSAKLTYKAELIETLGHQFITDWWWRYKIRIEEAIFGINVEGTVNAWQMTVSGGRMHTLDIVMGEPRAGDVWREIAGRVGMPGPRFWGNRWRNRRQA